MEKLDDKNKKMILEMLDKLFTVSDNYIEDCLNGGQIYPEEIQKELTNYFDLDDEGIYLVIFDWLYQKDFENIFSDWNRPDQFNYSGSSDYLIENISWEDITISSSGTTGSNNIIIGADIAIGDDVSNTVHIDTNYFNNYSISLSGSCGTYIDDSITYMSV